MKNLILIGWLLFAGAARAVPTGIVGASGKQGLTCNGCHSGGAQPSVTLDGPLTLATGQRATYQFVIQGGAGVSGGLDVALSSSMATLTATMTSDTYVSAGELTHSRPLPFIDGKVTVSFDVTAPKMVPGNGILTLYAAGNSTNGDGDDTGDLAATTTLGVMIEAADGGAEPTNDSGSQASDGGTATGGEPDLGTMAPDQGTPALDLGGTVADQGTVSARVPTSMGGVFGRRSLASDRHRAACRIRARAARAVDRSPP